MLMAGYAAKHDVGDWESPDSKPPAYAKLCGPEGFTSYITKPVCMLGRLLPTTISLANCIGFEDPLGLPGTPGQVDIHLGDDTSVAR
jgi:hypothetical protein